MLKRFTMQLNTTPKFQEGGSKVLRRSSAFTLIELLVVIAIIAILAAILFPVFAQARESARIATCLSNLKQIALGMEMYAQDYDETFPGSRIVRLPGNVDGDPVKGHIIGYKTVTFPYIKNYQIWQCPSNPNRNIPTEENDKNFMTSYASNGVLIYDQTGPQMAALDHPAEEVMMLESLWQDNDLGDWVAHINNPPACQWGTGFFQHRGSINPGSNDPTQVKPNGGMGNWAFFDGHVKAEKFAAVFLPKGPAGGPQYNGFGREIASGDWGQQTGDTDSNLCPLYK
jgi:prepilin-type N-terminal cleavage/methylation domain-containing protein/prepilin-type processing-associated H-X9-DG protein